MKTKRKGCRLVDAVLVTFISLGVIFAAIELTMGCSSRSTESDITEVEL